MFGIIIVLLFWILHRGRVLPLKYVFRLTPESQVEPEVEPNVEPGVDPNFRGHPDMVALYQCHKLIIFLDFENIENMYKILFLSILDATLLIELRASFVGVKYTPPSS